MKYLRAIAAGVLAALAFLAGVKASGLRRKARDLAGTEKLSDLEERTITGTEASRDHARRAKEAVDAAAELEASARKKLESGIARNEEIDNIFHLWDSESAADRLHERSD